MSRRSHIRGEHDIARGTGLPAAVYVYQGAGQADEPWHGPKCGTNAGYLEHRRNQDARCEECSAAHREYMRVYRLRTGRTRTVRVYLTPAQLAFLSRTAAL